MDIWSSRTMGLTGKSPMETCGDYPWRPTETHRDHQTSQSFICLAPYHQTTCGDPQRPVETTLVSHLPSPCHQTSQSFIYLAPCHQTSQSFALPPATKPVNLHLPCPLPPNQLVICLAPCHQTTCRDHPQRPPAETCRDPQRPPVETTHRDHPQRPPTETHGDHLQRPMETTLVSHLSCPLPPNQSVIHLPCPMPPNQSVICLAPATKPPTETLGDHLWRPMETTHGDPQRPTETCGDHISQSFALPPATKPVRQSFALPPATKPPAETHGDHLWRPPTETTRRDPWRTPAETQGDPQRHLKFDWSIFPTTFNDIIGTDFDWLISPPQPIRSFGLNNLINIKSWIISPPPLWKVYAEPK